FDEVCADDELQTKKIIKFRLGGRAHKLTLLEFARRLGLYQAVKLEEDGFNVYFEGGLRNETNFEGDPQNDHLWFMSKDEWDLYDRMGRMEIRQDAIERMEYRQGAYNPPGYAQPQYDQYYQQYQPPPPQYQQQQDDDE
ncbi:hypothetical protein Tco_0643493, partial [Tanacetum coccineum]